MHRDLDLMKAMQRGLMRGEKEGNYQGFIHDELKKHKNNGSIFITLGS